MSLCPRAWSGLDRVLWLAFSAFNFDSDSCYLIWNPENMFPVIIVASSFAGGEDIATSDVWRTWCLLQKCTLSVSYGCSLSHHSVQKACRWLEAATIYKSHTLLSTNPTEHRYFKQDWHFFGQNGLIPCLSYGERRAVICSCLLIFICVWHLQVFAHVWLNDEGGRESLRCLRWMLMVK